MYRQKIWSWWQHNRLYWPCIGSPQRWWLLKWTSSRHCQKNEGIGAQLEFFLLVFFNLQIFLFFYAHLLSFSLWQLYAESLARFGGGSPYIYPLYGLGELPQVRPISVNFIAHCIYSPFSLFFYHPFFQLNSPFIFHLVNPIHSESLDYYESVIVELIDQFSSCSGLCSVKCCLWWDLHVEQTRVQGT